MTHRAPDTTQQRIEEGRALFNAGRFFEAHEAWEDAWRQETGRGRRLLQGLIQIAAGLHKASGGAAGACARLLEAGLEKIADSEEPALQAFSAEVRASLEEARRWERGEAAGVTAIPALSTLRGVK